VVETDDIPEDDVKAPPQEIYDWITTRPERTATPMEIRGYFDISRATWDRRLPPVIALGAEYHGGRGKPARLTVQPPTDDDVGGEQLAIAPHGDTEHGPEVASLPQEPHEATRPDEATQPHNHAGYSEVASQSLTEPVRQLESGDLQGDRVASDVSSLRDACAPERTPAPEPARARPRGTRLQPHLDWINTEGWLHDVDTLTAKLIDRGVSTGDLPALLEAARARQEAEFGQEPSTPMDGEE
jgi:hypothetical protein